MKTLLCFLLSLVTNWNNFLLTGVIVVLLIGGLFALAKAEKKQRARELGRKDAWKK